MQPSTLAKRLWLLLFLVVGLSYLFGLGHFALVGPDEPRYAQVAREMFLRRDLITPTLGGYPWFEKPALLYWMMVASFSVFGVSEWAARLGPALSGLLTVAAVYWIGPRLRPEGGNEEEPPALSSTAPQSFSSGQFGLGNFGALVAASSGGLIVFSRGASFDILITISVTWALAFFWASEISKDERKQRWFRIGFWSFVGLSLLAKGLVGIVVPFGVIAAYFCLRRRLPKRSLLTSVLWGAPLALVVSAVWYGPVIARNGWPFVDQFFIQHHFARYLSNKYHHPQPFYFYLPVVLLLALPWTPFLIEALFKAIKAKPWLTDDAAGRSLIFLLAWLGFPLLFFSLSGSKLPGYVLPAMPAAALLAGDSVARFVSRRTQGTLAMRSTGVLLVVLSLMGVVYAGRFGNVSLKCSFLVISPLILAGIVATIWAQRRLLAAVLIALAVLAFVVLSLTCAASRFTERETVRQLVLAANAQGFGAAPLFMFETGERTAEFYAAGRVAYGSDGEPVRLERVSQIVDQARKARGPILLITRPRAASQLANAGELRTTVIGTNGRVTLVAVQLN